MNQISGYLELNGDIYKISSYEDIQAFLSTADETTCEPTEEELDKLCSVRPEIYDVDDCNVRYGKNPIVLWHARFINHPVRNYRINDGTIAIHDSAFFCLPSDRKDSLLAITSIYMPNSILAIGKESFYGLSNLSKIIFSNSLIKIGANAFHGCKSLTEVTLPKSLKYIGSLAFADCNQLKTIRLMSKPENLGSDILCNCNSLERIEIPVGSKEFFVNRFYPLDKDLFVEK